MDQLKSKRGELQAQLEGLDIADEDEKARETHWLERQIEYLDDILSTLEKK
jgi:hypothetical protein